MDLDFSVSSLAVGFVFGVFGFYLLKDARKKGHVPNMLIGLVLLIYPYFVVNPYLAWGIGFALLYLAYRLA